MTLPLRASYSVNDIMAWNMADYVRTHYRDKFARYETKRGAFVVLDVAGDVLISTPMGEWQPRHLVIAMMKARTALHLQANTGLLDPATLAGHGTKIETTFAGGVALFSGEECRPEYFVGVAAFSGVPLSAKDVELVVEATRSVGLFTKSD